MTLPDYSQWQTLCPPVINDLAPKRFPVSVIVDPVFYNQTSVIHKVCFVVGD